MMPDQSRPFQIEADALKYASGAVLTQMDSNGDRHPVAYFSKTFNDTERNYEIYDRELLGVICALEEWCHYIQGSGHTSHTHGPSEPDLFQVSSKTESATGLMGTIPIGIQFETCSHSRNKNDSVRCIIKTTGLYS